MGKKLKEMNNSPINVVDEESGIFYGHAQIHSCAKETEDEKSKCNDNFDESVNYANGKDTLIFDEPDSPCQKETKAELKKLQSVDDDFLQTLLFPHLETTLKDEIMGTKPRSRTYEFIKRSRNITKFFAEFLYPSRTRNNMKIFGGKKAVELERERAKHSGYIIHPCSKFRQYWDLIIMVMLVLNMFILPLDIAFFNSKTWVGFHITSDCLCMLDIVFNFRTGYRTCPKMKAFELDQGKIAKQYLKSWFTLDLISSLPLHYVILLAAGEPENLYLGLKGASRALKFLKVVKLLNLLKLLRLSRIIRGISQYEDVYCITTSLMRYIKLVSMMMMVAHWNGCFHFLVPLLQDFPNECWVKLCNIQDEQWYIQYGWALFKTLSHMLSIGYGRYTPILLSEAIITIFSMVTGATFYALFIAHSMAFIIQHDLSKTCYQEKVKQIDEYMAYRNLPDRIKKRVTVYFNQKFCQGRFFNEDDVLSGLSRPLRNDIVRYTCQDIVEKIPFLKNASPEFVSSILSKITSDVYLAGDTLLKEGSCLSEMYFVKSGTLELTVNDTIVETLSDGSYFGEISALSGKRSMYSVTAITACDVFILSGNDTKFILDEYDEMRPLIEHVAIERILLIYKECDLASLDERRLLTSCNSPEENDINHSLILLHETIKENLDVLLTNSIEMKNENKDTIIQTDTLEVKRLFIKLLDEHRLLHGVCDIYNPNPVVDEVTPNGDVTS